jgi:DNA polymerase-3 subunit beta
MKFSIKRDNFQKAISKVDRILAKNPSLPVLANILIKTEKNRLILASTNLEISIKTYVKAKIHKEGGLTIPVRVIQGFLNNIKDEVIDGEVNKKEEFIIRTEKHQIKIKGMNQEDYPIIPENPKKSYIKINSEELNQNLSNVLISVAHNNTRQELNGINVNFFKDKLVLASTDGYRLSEIKIKLDKNKINEEYFVFIENNPSIIIPALTLSEIQKNLTEGEVEFMIKHGQLFIGDNSTKIISKLINGNYIDYQQILPKKYSIEIKINKEELLKALKISSLVSRDNNGEIEIKNSKNNQSLEVVSFSSETGENYSQVSADISGGDFKILFNCNYLIDGLNVINEKQVVIKLNQEKSPALLKGLSEKEKENNDFSYIIMPIIKD